MITYTLKDGTILKYETFEIIDNEDVISINCSHNELTSLPENMNFPNLQKFTCHKNKLTGRQHMLLCL